MSGSAKLLTRTRVANRDLPWELREGECVEGLSLLQDASVDVVITDPPYEAEAHTSQRLVARAGGRLALEPLTFPPITEAQRTASARQMARLSRRWILVFCQVEAAMKWRAELEAAGAVYKRTCLWVKARRQAAVQRRSTGHRVRVHCRVSRARSQ
jgi:DNA modification methylase